MKAKLAIKANNTYKVELINSSTGEVKQEGSFHNIITNEMKRLLVFTTGTDASSMENNWYCTALYKLRCGSGTTPPSATDTKLTTPIWSLFTGTIGNVTWVTPTTARCTGVYTIPANASYVGTVTEIGLYPLAIPHTVYGDRYTGENCVTHALLTDSEGQIISFEKTDLDILKITVTIELSFSIADETFIAFPKPNIFTYMLNAVGSLGAPWPYGSLELRRFHKDLSSDVAIIGAERPSALDTAFPNSHLATNNGTLLGIKWPKVRLGSDSYKSETYFNGLAITGLGGWRLPNESIFPAYTIQGISIGTGDGQTTQFLNPLSYFKKDTDKVYKNGVQLTRGVDYTINSSSDANHIREISNIKGLLPKKVTYAGSHHRYAGNAEPLLLGTLQGTTTHATGVIGGFTNTAPLKFEYDEPVTLNYIKAVNLGIFNGSNQTFSGTIMLEYSTDGETYTEAARGTGNNFDVSFVETTAKYWQLKTTTTTSSGDTCCTSKDSYIVVGHSEPYITFTEAPAEGDTLTMDVDMDIIMKNSNFVVDAEASIDFVVGG